VEDQMAGGKIVVVTGASRGLGRGIARQFGRLGATVYLTSRATSKAALRDAAAEVDAGGGTGIAVSVDHREPAEAEALIARVKAEQGRLDILVNNAAAVHEALGRRGAFWEKPLSLADMIEVGLRSSYTMCYFAAPVMIARRQGLIANISFYGASTYFHGPAYGAAKAGTDKMSFDMGVDLRPHNVTCVSLWPGFIYSDALAQFIGSAPAEMIPERLKAHLPNFEHPEFSALVLNALHDDPARMTLTGQALIAAELGARYGIVDINGRHPPSYRGPMGQPHVFIPPSPDQPMSEI
jgi:NAD(P)-dependent dehydrogenase (short-subunit alcohol dehydrogenase family)